MCMRTRGLCVGISKILLIFSIKLFENQDSSESSKRDVFLCISFVIILSLLTNEILFFAWIPDLHLCRSSQPNICAFTDTFIEPNGSDQRNLNKAMCKVEVEHLFGDNTFSKL